MYYCCFKDEELNYIITIFDSKLKFYEYKIKYLLLYLV